MRKGTGLLVQPLKDQEALVRYPAVFAVPGVTPRVSRLIVKLVGVQHFLDSRPMVYAAPPQVVSKLVSVSLSSHSH